MKETRTRHASVMLLCGLPGSGKSTSAKRVVSSFTSDAQVDDPHDELHYERVHIIDYDDITEKLLHQQLQQKGQKSNSSLFEQELDSSSLDSLVSCVRNVIQGESSNDHISSNTDKISESNAEPNMSDATFVKEDDHCYDSEHLRAWKRTRTVALQILQRILRNHFQPTTTGRSLMENDKQNILIVLDDNFYLKSMRHRVFQICQSQLSECTSEMPCNGTPDKAEGSTSYHEFSGDSRMVCSCSFSVAFFNTPAEECKRRNATRCGRSHVPENVIEKMAISSEFPSAAKEAAMADYKPNISCDRNVAILDSETDNALVLDALRRLLHEAMLEPISYHNLQEEATLEAQKQRDREITTKNIKHRTDVILRLLVGQTAKLEKRLARYANEARKSILDQAKHQPPGNDDQLDIEEDIFSNILFLQGIADNFVSELVLKTCQHEAGSGIIADIGGVEEIKQHLLKQSCMS